MTKWNLYPQLRISCKSVLVWNLQSLPEVPGTAKLVQTISPVFGVQTWEEAPIMEKNPPTDIVTKCVSTRKDYS